MKTYRPVLVHWPNRAPYILLLGLPTACISPCYVCISLQQPLIVCVKVQCSEQSLQAWVVLDFIFFPVSYTDLFNCFSSIFHCQVHFKVYIILGLHVGFGQTRVRKIICTGSLFFVATINGLLMDQQSATKQQKASYCVNKQPAKY